MRGAENAPGWRWLPRPCLAPGMTLALTVGLALPSVAAAPEPGPREVSPEMRRWVRRQVMAGAGSHPVGLEALHGLWRTLTARDGLGLREEVGATRSAAETFQLRRGDCVAFAHLFVALGRELGAEVGFVVFESPEAIEEVGGGRRARVPRAPRADRPSLRVATGHMAAGWVGADGVLRVFDFGDVTRAPRRARWISDAAAEAVFHSNLGVAALLARRSTEALVHLERAAELAPWMAVVWVNLGVARRRAGDVDGAVAAYRLALALEPGSPAAQSSLRAAR